MLGTADNRDHPDEASQEGDVVNGDSAELPASTQKVAAALREAGIEPHIRQLADSARTAAEAAAALGCPIAAIANSLVFHCDDTPLLVMTSGAHRVDTAALAARLRCGRLVRATPEQVRAATGQVIGGVAPVGHPAPLTTIVDQSLAEHDRIWASAGAPHTVFATTFTDLLAVTRGRALCVTA